MSEILRARSAAKINLTLDVTGTLPNGYHELQSIVHTVGLWDELELEFIEGERDHLTCSRVELESPVNLCLKAVRLWRETFGDTPAVRVHLTKNIPYGAGLGGGSGNAAAILQLLRHSTRIACDEDEFLALASRLGADVPLFLRGGAMLMEGIGDRLSSLEPLSHWLVLVKPPFGMSTPAVYGAWDGGNFQSRSDSPALLEAWPPTDGQLSEYTGNDLATAARALGFELDHWLDPLRETGALASGMTGSGSAVFGLFPDEAAARKAEEATGNRLADQPQTKEYSMYCVPFTAHGVEIL